MNGSAKNSAEQVQLYVFTRRLLRGPTAHLWFVNLHTGEKSYQLYSRSVWLEGALMTCDDRLVFWEALSYILSVSLVLLVFIRNNYNRGKGSS